MGASEGIDPGPRHVAGTCSRLRTTSRGYATVCPRVPAKPPQASRVTMPSSRSSDSPAPASVLRQVHPAQAALRAAGAFREGGRAALLATDRAIRFCVTRDSQMAELSFQGGDPGSHAERVACNLTRGAREALQHCPAASGSASSQTMQKMQPIRAGLSGRAMQQGGQGCCRCQGQGSSRSAAAPVSTSDALDSAAYGMCLLLQLLLSPTRWPKAACCRRALQLWAPCDSPL